MRLGDNMKKESQKPIDIVKIRFADFKKYYSINAEVKKR